MAKPKRKHHVAPVPQPLGLGPVRTSHNRMDADSRMAAALAAEASFLRSTGYPEKAALIEAAVPAIGYASSERILADLRA